MTPPPNLPPAPKALIFDVDGTLAETEEAHRLAFNAAFAEAGLDWRWSPALYTDLLKVTGGKERIRAFMDTLPAPPSDAEALIRRLHARKTALYVAGVAAGETPLRPGVKALIQAAHERGLALALATTTTRENVDQLLAVQLAEQAAWFEVIVCGDMVAAKKPAPDVYIAALKQLGLAPDQALAIEDSENGVLAARGADLAVIATPSLYSAEDDFSRATARVCEPKDILALLHWA